jgi:hypothetical protein
MNRVHELHEINISTSPVYLRKLADKMEEKWPTLRAGDSTFVDIIGYTKDGTMIKINIDQEWFDKPVGVLI